MKQNIVAIIQARMESSRFPGKALERIQGMPILEIVIRRVQKSSRVNAICVAVPQTDANKALVSICNNMQIAIFQGSEHDVLDRYYQAARVHSADIIVRITADNPLVDPEIIDECISALLSSGCDYASNSIVPSYPEGLNVEVFTRAALEKAHAEARLASEREHVCPYMWKNPERFSLRNIQYSEDYSHWRWTVDREIDLIFFRTLFSKSHFTIVDVNYKRVIQFLNDKPNIASINSAIPRNEGYQKSLQYDTLTAE